MNAKLILSGLALIALIALSTLTYAQDNTPTQSKDKVTGRGSAYVDNNNNGVCDNYENNTPRLSGTKNKGQGNGKCYAQGQKQGQRYGQKQGQKQGQGQGRNRNFVDANKNGICDHAETPATN